MKRSIAFIIFIITNAFILKSNQPFDKIDDLQAMSLDNASLIFLGEIINYTSSTDTIKYRIFEKYKGNYNLDSVCVIRGIDEYIDFYPYDGLWLVYLKGYSDSIYHFCDGNLSRSLKHPEGLFLMTYIENFVDSGYDTTSLRIDAISDWFLELDKLRRLDQTKVIDEKNTGISKLMIMLLIFSIINFLMLVYFLINKYARS